MPRESTIQTSVKKRIKQMFPSAEVRVLHVGAYGTKGDPDLYACVDGQMIQIETKQPGRELEKIQAARLRQWARAGAICIKADSADFVESVLSAPFGWAAGKIHMEGKGHADRVHRSRS